MDSLLYMVTWSKHTSHIPINLSKFHFLRLGKDKSMWQYFIDSNFIKKEGVLKDFGI